MATDRLAQDDLRQRRAIASLSGQLDALGLTDEQSGLSIPRWVKASLTFEDFRINATTKQVALYTLPAGWLIHGVKIEPSESFRGPGIATYTISVGNLATPAKYASAFNVYQSPGATVYQITNVLSGESHDADSTIYAQAVTGGSLSNATSGKVDIWLLVAEAV